MSAPVHGILHVDMDAFYAAVEVLDRPELRGLPLVVGAPPDRRGVVSTASYEARRFGVHSAMPSRTAYKLCPQAVFVPPRMERYEEVSKQVMDILHEFTPLVEQVSVDEAFLDVRGALHFWPDAVALARAMKERIQARVRLTASVGVAPNKYLAKVASDMHKPDGLTVVPLDPEGIRAFLAPLPVSKIWGVGKVTEQHLHQYGLRTIGQIQALTPVRLRTMLGPSLAEHVWQLAQGQDDREVVTEWEEKSISNELTFDEDCAAMDVVRQNLLELAENVGARLRQSGKLARTAQIKVRFADFRTITRQCSMRTATATDRVLLRHALELFEREKIGEPVRLIGFGVSNLAPRTGTSDAAQEDLFPELPADSVSPRDEALDRAVDSLREAFGPDALRRGHWRQSESDGPAAQEGNTKRSPGRSATRPDGT